MVGEASSVIWRTETQQHETGTETESETEIDVETDMQTRTMTWTVSTVLQTHTSLLFTVSFRCVPILNPRPLNTQCLHRRHPTALGQGNDGATT
eukprot:1638048-Rhodomonas_salina.2